MATSLIDLYKNSEYSKVPTNTSDKTPISDDGGVNLMADKKYLNTVRGGEILSKPYSSTVKF